MTWGYVASAAATVVGSYMANKKNNSSGSGSAAADMQAQIASEQWDRYKTTYAPLEDKMVADAQKYDSPENFAKAAGDAASTVSEQFGKARDRLSRTPGLDPSSGAYQASVTGLDLTQAATDATQQNAARQSVKDISYARKLDALSLGKGIPAQASASLNASAQNGLNQSRFNYGVGLDQANALGSLANRAFSAWGKNSGGGGGGGGGGSAVDMSGEYWN